MTISFPNTEVKSVTWSNYSGTINGRSIPVYCTPEGGSTAAVMRKHGDAIRAILGHCFAQNPPAAVRALGSTWSFSRVIEPPQVAIDPANFTFIARAPAEHFTPAYQARAAQGFTPMFIEGGTQIAGVNRRLANEVGVALQTSGSGDGHRIAGCIATGTHGAALTIGALHDTALGIYLVVAPDRAVFVQSGSKPFASDGIAAWLQALTGIPTTNVPDDDIFHAALVSLGSLGFVFGVVVETVPLYQLARRQFSLPFEDDKLWHAMRTLDTRGLHPEVPAHPYHFDVLMHPYPSDSGPGATVTLMWNMPPANGASPQGPLPGIPRASSDHMSLIAGIAQAVSGQLLAGLTEAVISGLIDDQLHLSAAPSDGLAFPGQIFGPTTLPPGTGASTEIVVDHTNTEAALRVVYSVLNRNRTNGRFLLGAVAARFVPQSKAWLAMNAHKMNCFIELPSIRNDNVLSIYREIWDALEDADIPFTCHWGQLHGMNPGRLRKYFGSRIDKWKEARASLLDAIGLRVFAAPILSEVGLDG
jgi:hypothetical protein